MMFTSCSLFHYLQPLPSAPPHPSHQERVIRPKNRCRSESQAPHTTDLVQTRSPSGGTHNTKQKPNKMSSSSCEKVDLSTTSPQKRVPKRLPPPPPFPHGATPVHPRAKPRGKQRPLSNIPLGSCYPSQAGNDLFIGPPPDIGPQPEEHISRGSRTSTSVYDMADSRSNINDYRRPLSAAFHPSHVYECIDNHLHPSPSHIAPLEASMPEEEGEPLYSVPIRRGMAVLNRQGSTPVMIPYQQQQEQACPNSLPGTYGGRRDMFQTSAGMPTMASASDPMGHVYHMNKHSPAQVASPSHQYMMDPQHSMHQMVPLRTGPYGDPTHTGQYTPTVATPLTHAQTSSVHSGKQPEYLQQALIPQASAQQQTVPSLSFHAHPALVANSQQMVPQTTVNKPLPKPRSLAQPGNQLALVPISNTYTSPPSLAHNIPNIPSPANEVGSLQQSNQHLQANQILAAVPGGMSQLHSYSYTQQSSTVVMGIPQAQSIAGLSPHSNSITGPEQLNVQLVPQQLQQQQSLPVNNNVSVSSKPQNQNLMSAQNLEPSAGNENPTSSQAALKNPVPVSLAVKTSPVLPGSPQREPKRPVPKPRLMKKQSEAGDLGAASEVEGIEELQRTDSMASESSNTESSQRDTELDASSGKD